MKALLYLFSLQPISSSLRPGIEHPHVQDGPGFIRRSPAGNIPSESGQRQSGTQGKQSVHEEAEVVEETRSALVI